MDNKTFWYFSMPFILILAYGCSNEINSITGKSININSIPEEVNEWPAVYFCPKDNCSALFAGVLDSAESSLYCAFFDLNLNNVMDTLLKKDRKIDVMLVVDNTNYPKIKNISLKNFRQDNSNQLMHNKFCVIDEKAIVTGSFNPTKRDAYYNNNNVIVIHSKYIAENYMDEFKELWNGAFGSGNNVGYPIIRLNNKRVENYFCPEDNCKMRVINEIGKAKKSIYFMTFSFTDEEIADAILFKHNITVKGVFEKMQAGSKYSQYKRLNEFGLNVKLDNNTYNMHHKVFIIDNKTVITGSYNPTGSGSYKNDENIIIIEDKGIAKKYLEEFNYVWGEE